MPKLWRSGHIVIPKALRDAYDIHPGDEVEFVERDGDVFIRKVPASTGSVSTSEEERPS